MPPASNAGIRETSARDVATLWFFTTALRECRDPWAAKLAPEIKSIRAKASVRMWNLVSTTIAASIVDSGMEYLARQVRKRVGRWSNKRRAKDILACVGHVRFTPKSGHFKLVQEKAPCCDARQVENQKSEISSKAKRPRVRSPLDRCRHARA